MIVSTMPISATKKSQSHQSTIVSSKSRRYSSHTIDNIINSNNKTATNIPFDKPTTILKAECKELHKRELVMRSTNFAKSEVNEKTDCRNILNCTLKEAQISKPIMREQNFPSSYNRKLNVVTSVIKSSVNLPLPVQQQQPNCRLQEKPINSNLHEKRTFSDITKKLHEDVPFKKRKMCIINSEPTSPSPPPPPTTTPLTNHYSSQNTSTVITYTTRRGVVEQPVDPVVITTSRIPPPSCYSTHLNYVNTINTDVERRFLDTARFQSSETLDIEQYVQEVRNLKDKVPPEFFGFYLYVSRKQIFYNQKPLSFNTFLELHNNGHLARYHENYLVYVEKHKAQPIIRQSSLGIP